ncbi:MAG: selenium-dependent molybdenum cofactor biosynthesis protein YqeB [Candidatus Promineifilaceae bacterium]
MFENTTVIIRGGGDLGTGVAFRLHHVGFQVVVLELAWPMVIRRRVALASAIHDEHVVIEDLEGLRVENVEEALNVAKRGIIPVLVAPELPPIPAQMREPSASVASDGKHEVVVDARLAKRNIDTNIDQAQTVIALGPGFEAGIDCHAVIETMRGHRLGRVIWKGSSLPNTGVPGIVGGRGAERVLRAPADGNVDWSADIGDLVHVGQILGSVGGLNVAAPFDGVVRGLIRPGTSVSKGYKVGDIDSRGDIDACFTISDKALSIGGGVLEAVLARMNQLHRYGA